jgi:hypothetical protein
MIDWLEYVSPAVLVDEIAGAMAWRKRGVDTDRDAYDAIRSLGRKLGVAPSDDLPPGLVRTGFDVRVRGDGGET